MSLPANVTFWVAIGAGLLLLLLLVYLIGRLFARKRMVRRQMSQPMRAPLKYPESSVRLEQARRVAAPPAKKRPDETQLIWEGQSGPPGVPNEGPDTGPIGKPMREAHDLPKAEPKPEDFPSEIKSVPQMFEPEAAEPENDFT